MIYDLTKQAHKEQFLDNVDNVIKGEKRVELVVKRNRRSLKCNNYMHLLFAAVVMETGESMERIKQYYFKEVVNPEIFIVNAIDSITGEIYQRVKSTTELDSKESSVCIDNFKIWSEATIGLSLPEPEDREYLQHIEEQWSREKHYQNVYVG